MDQIPSGNCARIPNVWSSDPGIPPCLVHECQTFVPRYKKERIYNSKVKRYFLKSNHCQETSLKYFTNQNFIASQSRLPVGLCVGTPGGVGSNDGNFSC